MCALSLSQRSQITGGFSSTLDIAFAPVRFPLRLADSLTEKRPRVQSRKPSALKMARRFVRILWANIKASAESELRGRFFGLLSGAHFPRAINVPNSPAALLHKAKDRKRSANGKWF
jgi:hypothetical protein